MKLKTTLVISFLLFTSITIGQISVPADSIKNFLCHKWNFKAILMGGQQMTNMNESVTYEFLSDNTFKRLSSNGKAENGTWTYQSEQKNIFLKLKKTKLHVSSLTKDEMIIMAGDGKDESKNSLGVGTVLKINSEN